MDACTSDHRNDLADSLSQRYGPLAAVDILIVRATIICLMVVAWKHYLFMSVAQVPYFVWVSIATVLQLSITFWNCGR